MERSVLFLSPDDAVDLSSCKAKMLSLSVLAVFNALRLVAMDYDI